MTSSPTALRTSRHLLATPEQVFAAFTDPARLARWWGPAGFSNSFHRFEGHEGGLWHFTMHGPNGQDYANECRFLAVEAPRRWVIQHLGVPHFILSLVLQPLAAGGTQLDWCQDFEDEMLCQQLAPVCVPANEQNLDRLEAELAGRTPPDTADARG
jgi:hypothetical protein